MNQESAPLTYQPMKAHPEGRAWRMQRPIYTVAGALAHTNVLDALAPEDRAAYRRVHGLAEGGVTAG